MREHERKGEIYGYIKSIVWNGLHFFGLQIAVSAINVAAGLSEVCVQVFLPFLFSLNWSSPLLIRHLASLEVSVTCIRFIV